VSPSASLGEKNLRPEVGAIRDTAQPLQVLVNSSAGLQGAMERAAELQRVQETQLTPKGCVGQGLGFQLDLHTPGTPGSQLQL